jgi:hypothetical protein
MLYKVKNNVTAVYLCDAHILKEMQCELRCDAHCSVVNALTLFLNLKTTKLRQ